MMILMVLVLPSQELLTGSLVGEVTRWITPVVVVVPQLARGPLLGEVVR